jgi:hypothetical protein
VVSRAVNFEIVHSPMSVNNVFYDSVQPVNDHSFFCVASFSGRFEFGALCFERGYSNTVEVKAVASQ